MCHQGMHVSYCGHDAGHYVGSNRLLGQISAGLPQQMVQTAASSKLLRIA